MTPSSLDVLEDTTRLPALRARRTRCPEEVEDTREWPTLESSGGDTEYRQGVRFCELYRAESRSWREEAELSALYHGVYQVAFETASGIAHKAGFFDSETISDCAAGLVDFCARQYDGTTLGRNRRNMTFLAYIKAVAYSYLRKHRDFLSFSKKMTGSGLATGADQDILTAATFGNQDQRPNRIALADGDARDAVDTVHPEDLEPLYALEWSSVVAEGCDQPSCEASDFGQPENATLSQWVDRAVGHIRDSRMPREALRARAPAILEQLRSITGSRITDIAKRLIARIKTGCRIAQALLQALRDTLLPHRHEQTIRMIDAALGEQGTSQQSSAVPSPAMPGPIRPDSIPRTTEATEAPPPDPVEETVGSVVASDPDLDLGVLIDTSDLRHGRNPPAKPRYVTVDDLPPEPTGTPPPLDDDPTEYRGPPKEETVIVFTDRAKGRAPRNRLRPRKDSVRYMDPLPARLVQTGLALLEMR